MVHGSAENFNPPELSIFSFQRFCNIYHNCNILFLQIRNINDSPLLYIQQIIRGNMKCFGYLYEYIVRRKPVSAFIVRNYRFSNAQPSCQLLLCHFLSCTQIL